MKILSLETSTKNLSLALSEDARILTERNIRLKGVLSSSIIPAIRAILKKSKLDLKGLDGYAVGLGPGSFTSLRVGLSTVKGLAFATQKPVVGIPSLDVLAMNAPAQVDGPICALGDAKRNLVYACWYEKQNGELKRNSDYLLIGIEELLSKVGPNLKIFFIGEAVGLFKEKIARLLQDHLNSVRFASEKDWYPRARNLALLAHPKFLKKEFAAIDRLAPFYLYPEDCQARLPRINLYEILRGLPGSPMTDGQVKK